MRLSRFTFLAECNSKSGQNNLATDETRIFTDKKKKIQDNKNSFLYPESFICIYPCISVANYLLPKIRLGLLFSLIDIVSRRHKLVFLLRFRQLFHSPSRQRIFRELKTAFRVEEQCS